jgi:chromosomal replication initiation ATPase DnaA
MTYANFQSRPGSIHARSASAMFASRAGIMYREPILILAGRPGSGKTHLLHAAANLTKKNQSIRSGITICAQRLNEEVARAVCYGDLADWTERFSREDFLAIDDIDDLYCQPATADFLLNVLKCRAAAHRRTLLSAALSISPDNPCPLVTFLNHQRAVRLL